MSDITLVKDCKAYGGRWSEYACRGFGNDEVLYEEGESDWQGSAEILSVQRGPNPVYMFVSWGWGSCSGCDGYEDLSEEEITREFEHARMVLHGKDILRAWRDMLAEADKHGWRKGLIAAIDKELA